MKKVIPKFRTEEEEARFWDTHSPLDYPGEFVDVKEPFEFAPSLLKNGARKALYRKIGHNITTKNYKAFKALSIAFIISSVNAFLVM